MNSMDESQLAEQIESMKDDPAAWGAAEQDRPARSERRQRGTVVSVRLTLEELNVLQAYADQRGLSLSGTLRTTMLESAARAARRTSVPQWIRPSSASNSSRNADRVTSDVHSNYYTPRAV